MAILVDTNILLRSIDTRHPHLPMVERALFVLRDRNETLNVTVQNFVEFWAVATRPAANENGLGMTTSAAMKELTILIAFFPLLPEPSSIFDEWQRLVTTYKVSGKNTHDARLVAAMKANGIAKILTFNIQHFTRYKEIEALHPDAIGR